MDFMALFVMGTGGHYVTMLPAYWSISTSQDLFALRFLWWKMVRNTPITLSIKTVRVVCF